MGWGLALHHSDYKTYYVEKKKTGAHHYTCIIACARKFLRSTVYSKLYGREAKEVEGGLEIVWSITVEVEGREKPALVAEWVLRQYR